MSKTKERSKKPNLVILAIYKSREDKGLWKAFCAPYGITTQATSKKEAKKRIEASVELYEEGLEKYGYPKHLLYQEFSDKEDKKILNLVWKNIKIRGEKKIKQQKDFIKFAQEEEEQNQIRIDGVVASFYQPNFAI
jgi:predicted RNase H-like HicB family nuclease